MITEISEKQRKILEFGFTDSTYLICDGAVRSGKTVMMAAAFVIWAMENFSNCNFALCGKTIESAERNIVLPMLTDKVVPYDIKKTKKSIIISMKSKRNFFYLFGGKDEKSYSLIQGVTLAGVFLDEVALMPRSFVEQAMARTITYKNRKIWFSCNPESFLHWFNQEWVIPTDEGRKNATHLHFTLSDNPIITNEMAEGLKDQYSGVFYRRYILGEWCMAEGIIYEMFDKNRHLKRAEDVEQGVCRYYLSIDYGTMNAFSCGLWAYDGDTAYRLREYYYSGRTEKRQKTNAEYLEEIKNLASDFKIESVVVDPSAASFIAELRNAGFIVRKGKNNVVDGIRKVQNLLKSGKLLFSPECRSIISEFELYRWDTSSEEDKPVKDNDHAMDDMRYFVNTIMRPEVKINEQF